MVRRILHISPTYYSATSVVGGGEKYIVYMSRSIREAAANRGIVILNSILAFGQNPGVYQLAGDIACEVLQGTPWQFSGINLDDLKRHIAQSDIVMVHQCLSPLGLFVAAHCRLARKTVVGIDEGGGEHPLVHHTPEVGRIFDVFHAYSAFGASSFQDLEGRVEVVPGPVDTSYYRPNDQIRRDSELVLAVGRILPHKGFDRIIRALPGNLRLAIAGTRYDEEYYNHLLDLGRGKRVEMVEHLADDELLRVMQTAGLFVHASTHIDYKGRYYAKPELLGLAPLEALSAGTPAFVSSAGALPELASVAGCRSFTNDLELCDMLAAHAASPGSYPPAAEIHRDVERQYGLAVFGNRFLTALFGAAAAA